MFLKKCDLISPPITLYFKSHLISILQKIRLRMNKKIMDMFLKNKIRIINYS